MARTEYYSQNNHSLVIDGIAIEDFDEGDDVIAFEPIGDGSSVTRGLDKNKTSFASPRPGQLTIRLKPTSPSLARLNELVRSGESGNPRLFDVQVTTGVRDVLTLTGCSINENGWTTGGPTMQGRPYVIVAENYTLDE